MVGLSSDNFLHSFDYINIHTLTNMHSLNIKLKQVTPLIHFLGKEDGQFLRATELSPRLKSFMRQKEDDPNLAFNFSCRIYTPNCRPSEIIEHNDRSHLSGFFGNMGDDYRGSEKYHVYTDEAIKIKFRSKSEEDIKLITKHYNEFFLFNNFMTRQSKGFGSFVAINDQGTTDFSALDRYNYFTLRASNKDKIVDQFKFVFLGINNFSKIIRSGINHGIYFKSLLFQYLTGKEIQWDKKTLKKRFIDPKVISQQAAKHDYPEELTVFETNEEKMFLWRDILGLSASEEWGYYNNAKLSKSDESKTIERIPSPITLKPIIHNNDKRGLIRIYVIPHFEKHHFLSNKEFVVKYSDNNSTESMALKMGDVKIIEDFLPWVWENGINYQLSNDSERPNKKIKGITDMLQELNRNWMVIKSKSQ